MINNQEIQDLLATDPSFKEIAEASLRGVGEIANAYVALEKDIKDMVKQIENITGGNTQELVEIKRVNADFALKSAEVNEKIKDFTQKSTELEAKIQEHQKEITATSADYESKKNVLNALLDEIKIIKQSAELLSNSVSENSRLAIVDSIKEAKDGALNEIKVAFDSKVGIYARKDEILEREALNEIVKEKIAEDSSKTDSKIAEIVQQKIKEQIATIEQLYLSEMQKLKKQYSDNDAHLNSYWSAEKVENAITKAINKATISIPLRIKLIKGVEDFKAEVEKVKQEPLETNSTLYQYYINPVNNNTALNTIQSYANTYLKPSFKKHEEFVKSIENFEIFAESTATIIQINKLKVMVEKYNNNRDKMIELATDVYNKIYNSGELLYTDKNARLARGQEFLDLNNDFSEILGQIDYLLKQIDQEPREKQKASIKEQFELLKDNLNAANLNEVLAQVESIAADLSAERSVEKDTIKDKIATLKNELKEAQEKIKEKEQSPDNITQEQVEKEVKDIESAIAELESFIK